MYLLSEGSKYYLEGRTHWIIGRSSVCNIQVSDMAVSNRHCIIIRADDYFLLFDGVGGHPSRHGTFVNGERVVQRFLEPGDRIDIGRGTQIHVAIDEEEVTGESTLS